MLQKQPTKQVVIAETIFNIDKTRRELATAKTELDRFLKDSEKKKAESLREFKTLEQELTEKKASLEWEVVRLERRKKDALEPIYKRARDVEEKNKLLDSVIEINVNTNLSLKQQKEAINTKAQAVKVMRDDVVLKLKLLSDRELQLEKDMVRLSQERINLSEENKRHSEDIQKLKKKLQAAIQRSEDAEKRALAKERSYSKLLSDKL